MAGDLQKLETAADTTGVTLYQANLRTYQLLRYGAQVKTVIHGRFYVFVDECHRTQGGDMNRQMKRWLETRSLSASPGRRCSRRTSRPPATYSVRASGLNAAQSGLRLERKASVLPSGLQRGCVYWFSPEVSARFSEPSHLASQRSLARLSLARTGREGVPAGGNVEAKKCCVGYEHDGDGTDQHPL